MRYVHTQTSPIYLLVGAVAAALAVAAVMSIEIPAVAVTLGLSAAVVVVLVCSVVFLTVEGREDELVVRFGPFPLLGTRIPLDAIDRVERDRTTILDGWGVHYVPGRGWTYNLWGFDCVRIDVGGRTIRIGTDDPDGLLAFLEQRGV